MSTAYRDTWDDLSVELTFLCGRDGIVRDADSRAGRCGLRAGVDIRSLAAPGTQDKLQQFLTRAAGSQTNNVELALIVNSAVVTFAFSGKPAGEGIAVLGSRLPQAYVQTLRQVQDSMSEIVNLNREVVRQKQEIQRQRDELQRTVNELDESNKGVRSLHLELEEKAEVLQRAAEIKSRVVANVSHEFRTPLHTILGLSRLLLDADGGPLSAEQHRQVQYIRSSAEELSALVDDMLDLSSAESGRMLLRLQTVEAEDFLAALRGTIRPIVESNRNVELLFDAAPANVLETDQSKLSQILRNLIVNAMKFTERGEVKVSLAFQGENAVFRVTDTGIGIAEADLERIFEEFSQIDSHLQEQARGAGLGLPLSRKLAELLGGTLTVKSRPGKGSEFTLRIPRRHPDVAEIKELEERPLDPKRAPILVVEDDRKTIFIYERYLAMTGFQVVPARTIADAERLLATLRPAAIVLDIMLDGESSWNFLSKVKQDPNTHDIPVLVVTVTNKEQKARALGADEFWLKPLDQDRLLSKLKALGNGTPASVLAIDDDERSLYLLRRCLSGSPYRLMEAQSGQEGLRIARERAPSVILLDFLLETETAFDVLDELKADPATRHIPVIIVTSHQLEPGDRERLAQQTDVILSKESLSRELAINRIRDALHKAERRMHGP